MALEKAGINLTIQGEAQYIAGLRNINREMDLMALNTKLAVAQLGQGASPTQKFNTQMRHLGAEIQKASVKTIELRNRNKELPNTIFETGKSLDKLKDKFKEQGIVQEALTETQVKMRKQYGYQSDEWEAADKALKEHTKTYKETEKEVKALEAAYNGMLEDFETMPNQIAAATLATEKLVQEQAKLRKEYLDSGGVLAGFANKLESGSQKLQEYGRSVSDIGDSLMWVTGAIVAGGGGALKAYMDWETGLRGVQKTNDEVFDSNGNLIYSYADLESGLRELAKTIPVTHTELTELGEIAGRLQVPTDEVVMFTEVVAKLGETTNLTSEDAAEQLGKFINITGAGTETTLNLANALVELGNNTAASERETLRMSTRWASTGDIIGMTDDQILALSASVISLGIRTEAGGSAVQRAFLKINDAVLSGGDELASFAEVAGMSADEFKTAWQDDAAYALIPFLEGLHETHEAGGNVNQILRELGVTSVNELNTLLVLAGGYDQLAGNLELASGAYHETEEAMMALNQEAELAYGSTLGKLRTAWNRLKDSLIDIGEPIATAVLDIVDGAEPLFEWIEGLANGFSNLEKSAQQDIIKMVGQIALIAPALKIAGGAMTTLGDIGEMTSKGVRLFGKGITLAFTDVGKSAAELTTVAGTAAGSKGVGGLIAKLAGSAGLPWALGIAAAALGGWAIWKTWGEDAYKAAQQTERWGGTVSKETERTLDNFQNLSNNIKSANDSMAEDSEAGGRKVLDNYNGILEGIRSTVGDSTQAVEGFYQGLDTATKNILEESTNKHLEELQEIEKNAEKYYGYINRIYENAMAENRELTKEEMDRVERYHQMLANLQAEATAGTEEQIRQTRSVLTEQLEGMTEEQLALRTVMLREDLEAVKEKHAEELAEIDKKVAAGVYSEEQGQAAIQTMRNSYHREVQRLLDEEIKTFQARGTEERVMINLLNDRYKEYGYTREEIEARVQKVMKATQDDMLEADRLWENLLKDPVTGEINTNIPETIADMAQSEETWDELHFMIHNADLDTNSKAIMAEWVEASGYWDKLEPETKEFLGDAENFIKEVNKSEKWLKRWDDLPEEDKKILGDNYDILLKLVKSEEEYDRWLKLPEEDKKLLGNNTDVLNKILSSEQEYNRWLKLPERAKKLLADGSQVNTAVTNAKNKLNELKDREVTIRVRNETIYESIYRTRGNPSSQGFVDAGGRILHNARGTDFHPGGLAVVNDQKGAMFRELVTLPDGSSFIPSGRDVLLDLPKGSKVLRAALTKMKFPDIKQYQDGVGYSQRELRDIRTNNHSVTQNSKPVEVNVYQTINSPKEVDARESQRLSRINLQNLAWEYGGI